jgi:poly-gamma-glutamate synthesis protein (capsule biosynthesis protein)
LAGEDCELRLEWRSAGTTARQGERTALLERRWLAAPVGFVDPRIDVSPEEARAIGLVDLREIRLPRRALSVGGRLPGEEGYVFAEDLVLTLVPSRGRIPASLASWLEGIAKEAAPVGPPSPLVISAVGDMELGPDEAALLLDGGGGMDRLFGKARPFLERADILIGNLEGAVTDRTEGNPRKRFQFRFPPGASAALGRAGFDLLLFANNHGFDFGEGGFEDSLADARSAGMPLVGAGMDGVSAARPESLSRGEGGKATRFTFVGFAFYPTERLGFSLDESRAGPGRPGVNADEAATLAAIREAAAKGDFVVVLAHGGSEYRFEPSPEARRLYRTFVDAGARLVLGGHPHLLQGAEAYHDSLIAYSLGNFLFTGEKEPEEALESAMVRVLVFENAIRGFDLVPVTVGMGGTDLSRSPGLAMAGFMARCAELSRER